MNSERTTADSPPNATPERTRSLAARLAAELEEARADARAARGERDAAAERLRALAIRLNEVEIAARVGERERQVAEHHAALARDHVARMQPLVRTMRGLLESMQQSRFWKIRNAWFDFKHRAGRHPVGAQPYWVPDVDFPGIPGEDDSAYARWLLAHGSRPADLRRMRETLPLLAYRPRFSVLMPVYDAPERFLRAAIESVFDQVYPDWELCIADDASPAPHVREVLEEYAAADARVKLVFRETNGHIAASSNSALAAAGGEFVALLDHDDLLAPDALYEAAKLLQRERDADVIYSDEDKIDEEGRRSEPYFKPDWSPESFLSRNYVSHLGVYRTALVRELGGFREGFEGSQDYDLLLRASERTPRIRHIPRVLYHWRVHAGSTAAGRERKSYAHDAAARALEEALARRGEPAHVEPAEDVPGLYTVRYALRDPGLVSIIVPTRDHGDDVERCLRSVFERSSWHDFEVVLLDNGSTDPDSLRVFGAWLEREPERVRLVRDDRPFNFSALNNRAAAEARGKYLLFLNNDTEVVTPDWIEAMLEQAQRPPIGAVGAKLLYRDDTIQHAGVVIGLGGVAGHSHKHYPADAPGYFYTLQSVTNYSAVTAACMMMRRAVFEELGGFDESLAIAFNDVDLCLRARAAGYRSVYLPHVVLYHYESKSRGYEDTPEKMERFLSEQTVMRTRWRTAELPDPCYNPNLTHVTEDYAIGT
jgi:O-antigen biosynthesis protein